VHIEQQFFVTDTAGGGVKNGIGSAIVKRIKRAVAEGQRDFRVNVILPLSPAMGSSPKADPVCRKLVGFTYKSICRGKSSIMSQIRAVTDDADRYIGFYGLRQYGLLDSGKCATSQVYVHGKLIIVDDRHVICGSANINDRSMLSHSDSELAVLTFPSPGETKP
jgi:phospholipase D1/2